MATLLIPGVGLVPDDSALLVPGAGIVQAGAAPTVTGTGALASQSAAVAGSGTAYTTVTGTGALASQAGAISGLGIGLEHGLHLPSEARVPAVSLQVRDLLLQSEWRIHIVGVEARTILRLCRCYHAGQRLAK